MPTTRREFIKRTSAAVVGTSALSLKAQTFAAAASKIPPHAALQVAGVHAYADRESVAAGETISFHVSSTVSWRLSICRLGLKMDDPGGDQVLQRFRAAPPRAQPIHPGSYVEVKRGLTGRVERLSIECWIRLWKIGPPAAVVSQFDEQQSAGFALLVNPGAKPGLLCG